MTSTLVIYFLISPLFINKTFAFQSPSQKAILVTGASSGSGRMIAETLASKGYYVYAGARKEKDIKALNAIKNIQSFRLDVTKQSEIDAAVKIVINEGRGLYGLVNNAGVGLMAPLIELEEDDLNFIFNVNVYGPYRITKAFAPLIIKSKGRVINIGSIAGVQTTKRKKKEDRHNLSHILIHLHNLLL
ncbi:MAG: SDR family NAD(P)-dependent oxidoreductase [Gammaproteobacteria bacterium]|nr:SDR family NAD(P)-dependent oxidoreductase [Gammaproteobacteria bacterium]